MDITTSRPGTVRPPPRLAIAVRELIDRDGAPSTAARLGLSRGATLAIAARLPARRGTIVAAAHALEIEIDS